MRIVRLRGWKSIGCFSSRFDLGSILKRLIRAGGDYNSMPYALKQLFWRLRPVTNQEISLTHTYRSVCNGRMDSKQADLTRDKLLQAAFCEIHRQGFQAASIANILADTGLTKGALYHHFPTKQALGLAVIGEVIEARLDDLIFRQLRASEHPVETLLEIIAAVGHVRESEVVLLAACRT
jgi:hypothetical protein